MRKINVLALLAAMMLLPLAGGVAHAEENGPGDLAIAKQGIGELLERYDTRNTLSSARGGCNAYYAWQDFAQRNFDLTNVTDVLPEVFRGPNGEAYWWSIPGDVRNEALEADSLYDALLIIKANDIYTQNTTIKALLDAKLAEVNAFRANISNIEAEAKKLKQQLIKYYPDWAEEISNFSITTLFRESYHSLEATPEGHFGEVCFDVIGLRNFADGGETDAYHYRYYYPDFAEWVLVYDNTVLDGIELPLNHTASRAWNLVQQARKVPHYEVFYKFFHSGLKVVDFLKAIYPDLDIEIPDDDTAEEYYHELFEMAKQVPNYDEYWELTTKVWLIEEWTNDMKGSSGMAMLKDDATTYATLNSIAELTELLGNAEVDEPVTDEITADTDGNLPAAPNTGSMSDGELSGVVVKVAVTGIAIIATLAGAAIVAKRYVFSPLKRK